MTLYGLRDYLIILMTGHLFLFSKNLIVYLNQTEKY